MDDLTHDWIIKTTPISRRTYLMVKLSRSTDASIFEAIAAVNTAATEHPEWDMNEYRTLEQWEASDV